MHASVLVMSAIGLTTNLLLRHGDCYETISCEIGRNIFRDSQISLEIQLATTQNRACQHIFLSRPRNTIRLPPRHVPLWNAGLGLFWAQMFI
jgi:hypothetical protein